MNENACFLAVSDLSYSPGGKALIVTYSADFFGVTLASAYQKTS